MSKRAIVACVFALLLAALASPSMADPGRGADVQCYVWSNQASPAIGVAFSPSVPYTYNSIGRSQGNTVTRTAVGTYNVTCKGVGGGPLFPGSGSWGAGGHVQVTAYGVEDADYCKVSNWVTGGADFTATVKCFNHAGAASDNRFDLLFVW